MKTIDITLDNEGACNAPLTFLKSIIDLSDVIKYLL